MDQWSDLQLKKMRAGGNDQCAEFLKKHGVAGDASLSEKYDTPAAHLYQKVLSARIKGEPEPTELPELPKKNPEQRRSLTLQGFGSPTQQKQKQGLFGRFRSMSRDDDSSNEPRGSGSSAASSGNIGEIRNVYINNNNIGELSIDFTKKRQEEGNKAPNTSDSDREHCEQDPVDIIDKKQEEQQQKEEEEEDEIKEGGGELNIDDIVNQIIEDNDTAFHSRWSEAQKEPDKPSEEEKTKEDQNQGQNIFHRISRSSWFGGGQAAKNSNQLDKMMEEEIKKSEHDDIKSILCLDDTDTEATSQSPSAPAGEEEEEGISPTSLSERKTSGGFIRKIVSRTISGTSQLRDTREAEDALDKFMDGL